ncbi:unnamed protein product [Linum tenue]|uniref:LRAT domain-containing protein n=1 Tax=Linum tenue TaxID=586396 RepID=A0AAV0QSB3_9ROSI|nr:unnamed protein product [Linum tenue]
MGVLSNKVQREDLKPGDHIYSWRHGYVYSHHGISLPFSPDPASTVFSGAVSSIFSNMESHQLSS